MSRLNPVTLITGAATSAGAGFARALAPRAQGGLILVDESDEALSQVADSLAVAPERVSTLAFDVKDDARWTQASNFIESQYGRLDWAIVHDTAHAAAPAETDLVNWGNERPAALDGAFHSLRSLMLLMQHNSQGGAIVVSASEAALVADLKDQKKLGLLQLMRMAAGEGAHDNIRINAIAAGGAGNAPLLADLVRDTGSERAALDRVAHLPGRMARAAGGPAQLILKLLEDISHTTGATLIVDGDGAL